MYCRLFQALATVRAVLIVFQFAGAVTTTILMTTWRAGNIFPLNQEEGTNYRELEILEV